MERAKEIFKDCLQGEPAFCTIDCPFHLDTRDFISKIQRGSFNSAYRTYLNAVGFPGIVSELCGEPCKNVCPRRLKDGAISMRLLEKAALNFAVRTEPNSYNLPSKNKKVAVIGAGISGLACTLRLASKKYDVTLLEQTDRIGGHLWELLPPELFLLDIQRQFTYEQYSLCLNTEITRLDELDYDAVYVATGANGTDFGLARSKESVFASTAPGIFLGGSLTGGNTMQAIADGLHVAGAVEWFLKTDGMNHPSEVYSTRLEIDPSNFSRSEPVLPESGAAFTRDEAILEAKRCLKCACEACVRYCDLMNYFKKYPRRIEEEVEITIHPGTLDGNGTVATRFISTCHQCGLCKEVCPVDIDTGDFLLKSHRAMREKGAMPWAFHDFFLRDMAFTNGEEAYLARPPQGYTQSRYVFFPGCQLGASDPKYVTESYHWLLTHFPDTALMLGCCGAPAEWAGDEAIHSEVLLKLKEDWVSLGKPTVVFACPTCKQIFKRHLPEIDGVFLYDLILETGITPLKNTSGETVSVFDPCSSREEPQLQQGIRKLAKQAGFTFRPLPMEGKLAQCCSWGGQVAIANPTYTREVVKSRIRQNDYPFLTYCINCRDIFAAEGKPVYHILDILFGIHGSDRTPPTITQRRNNRVALKNQLLRELWKDEVRMESPDSERKICISAQLKQKLNDEMILENEIEAVIKHCESSGRKIFHPGSGHYSGHLQIGPVTYWVEYALTSDGIDLIHAYSHRMSIEEA